MSQQLKTSFNALVCENGCGSPTYGYSVGKWIFESGKTEQRVVAMGCECVQSEEYSRDLMNGKVQEPIYIGYDWIYPGDDEYEEALHYHLGHEKLIEILGLPRKEEFDMPPKRYS